MTGRYDDGTCPCGVTEGVRPYACGFRCPAHTPAAAAGQPEPGLDRYCAPGRCYCGDCPSWTPDTTTHPGATIIDLRAVASGKRRSGLAAYRDAQAQVHGRRGAELVAACTRCRQPLSPVLAALGETTHPCCDPDGPAAPLRRRRPVSA